MKLTPFSYIGSLVALAALCSPAVAGVTPKTKDARAIMVAVDDRDKGARTRMDATMVIVDKGGRKRQRRFRLSTFEFKGGTKRLFQFSAPADVRNVGMLTHEYDAAGVDDPQWMYLPRLRKSKRIAGADKTNAWMGSDFSYSDLTRQDPADYTFKLLKPSVRVDGDDCWLVEATPRTARAKQETGYVKLHTWVSKRTLVVLQSKAWVRKGQKIKLSKFTGVKKVGGVWVPHKVMARTLAGGKPQSTTVMTFSNVKVNAGAKVDADHFTLAHLERGL